MTVDDTLILNWNQVELQTLAKTTAANVLPFSTKEAVEGAYLLDGKLYFNEEYIMPADELGIPGSHNIENALAAICVAKLKNVSNAQIRQTLTNFSGVPHRTQFVGEVQQRRFYNDSKATNILATEMALSGFDNKSYFYLRVAWTAVTHLMNWFLLCWDSKQLFYLEKLKKNWRKLLKKRTLKQFYLLKMFKRRLPLPLIIRKKMILFYYHLLAQVGINTRISKYAGKPLCKLFNN